MILSIARLKAARKMAAHKDIRYYLNGVCIRQGYVCATNGHYAIKLDDPGASPETEIIVPNEVLDALFKKLKGPEYKRMQVVYLHQDADGWAFYADSERQTLLEFFRPIDGKFPDIDRFIPNGEADEAPGEYNWSHLQLFDQAYAELGGKYSVRLQQFGPSSAALVHFPGYDFAIGVVMALRK